MIARSLQNEQLRIWKSFKSFFVQSQQMVSVTEKRNTRQKMKDLNHLIFYGRTGLCVSVGSVQTCAGIWSDGLKKMIFFFCCYT